MKRILTTLCALAFVMAGSIPALAAEADADTGQSASYYPISVEEYTYGSLDEPRVEKVYQLSLSDDPSGIPTEDFVRNGRLYYLLDMTRKNEVGVDTKPHIETISQASDTNDMETILQQLNAELEVTTEDGYTGTLTTLPGQYVPGRWLYGLAAATAACQLLILLAERRLLP